MYKVNCVVFGDNSSNIFTVEIAQTQNVHGLRKLIKDETTPLFDHVAAYDLKLWKVSDLIPVI
jgi:hypothetical protein